MWTSQGTWPKALRSNENGIVRTTGLSIFEYHSGLTNLACGVHQRNGLKHQKVQPMTTRRTALFVALYTAVAAASGQVPASDRFDPTRNAAADVTRALAEAKRTGRRLMLDVGGEWCSWCKLMDNFFASNADVRTLRDQSYVWLKVNYSKENKNEALLSRYPKISGYPHLFVLDGDGKLVASVDSGPLEDGRGYSHMRMTAMLREHAKP